MPLLKDALKNDIGYNTDTGVLPVKGHPDSPEPGDITLRHEDNILLKTDRRNTAGDADEEIFSQGGSIETQNALFVSKNPTADITVRDGSEVRNLVRGATFSDGTVVGDIGGDVFITTENDIIKSSKASEPYWITRQGVFTTDSTGTSFYAEYTTSALNRRSTDGKIKSDSIPVGIKVQMKLSLQSAPTEYIWQNVSDEELLNGLGSDVNVSTGEYSLSPNIYIPGDTAVRTTLNFSESITLKGGDALGTDVYIEAYGEDIAFSTLSVDCAKYLGVYADLTALQTAHPTAIDGDTATVTSPDGNLFYWNGSAWEDTGTGYFGDMIKDVYDPTAKNSDAFARANHSGTQTHATISDYSTELSGTSNTTTYTPTADYHPATKKYVDDSSGTTVKKMTVTTADHIENLDVSSLSPFGVLFIDNTASKELKSLSGGSDGDVIHLTHISSSDLKIKKPDSFLGQQIQTPGNADRILGDYGGCTLIYNSTLGYWIATGLYF